MKFAWFDAPGGGRFPVNPDQVAYLRPSPAGLTCIVFGAVTGGMHELIVADGFEAAVTKLEGAEIAPGADLGPAPAPEPAPAAGLFGDSTAAGTARVIRSAFTRGEIGGAPPTRGKPTHEQKQRMADTHRMGASLADLGAAAAPEPAPVAVAASAPAPPSPRRAKRRKPKA